MGLDEFEKLKNELPVKLEIVITQAHWLINGKTYAECGFVEKYYFDLFLKIYRKKECTEKKY